MVGIVMCSTNRIGKLILKQLQFTVRFPPAVFDVFASYRSVEAYRKTAEPTAY